MIAPGALDRALREKQPVAGLFNHDMNLVLGSTKSGTRVRQIDLDLARSRFPSSTAEVKDRAKTVLQQYGLR